MTSVFASRSIPVLVALSLLAGCAAGPERQRTFADLMKPDQADPRPTSPRAQLQYHILAGEFAMHRGDRNRAAEEYVAALEYADDPALARQATHIAMFGGDPNLAYRAARAWADADPDSAEAQKTAARLALRLGTQEQLRKYAAAVVRQAEGPGTGLRELADVLSGEAEHAEQAMAAMAELVAGHSSLPEAHYSQALLAIRYDAFDVADKAVSRALELRPDWIGASLLRANLLVRRGRIEAASDWVASLEGDKSERSQYQIEFARMLLDEKRHAAAADAFERALELEPGNTDARYGLAVLALTLEQWERAKDAFNTLYESGQRPDDAAYYLGHIAELRGEYERARDWYRRVNAGAHAFDAEVRAAYMRYELGDLDGARRELQMLRYSYPDLAEQLYLAEGQLLYDARRYDTALALYNRALNELPGNPDLLYGRSLVYERLGAIDKAEADLRGILETEPNDARALNALGYMLTNHSSRYSEALDYIERALEAEPEDPAVMDSMGWIQYRLGHLDKAREYLRRAYEQFPDPEVAAHLGEVLWKIGDQAQARRVWQDALRAHPGHPILRETIERLTP